MDRSAHSPWGHALGPSNTVKIRFAQQEVFPGLPPVCLGAGWSSSGRRSPGPQIIPEKLSDLERPLETLTGYMEIVDTKF